jgi:hypothetical protein
MHKVVLPLGGALPGPDDGGSSPSPDVGAGREGGGPFVDVVPPPGIVGPNGQQCWARGKDTV